MEMLAIAIAALGLIYWAFLAVRDKHVLSAIEESQDWACLDTIARKVAQQKTGSSPRFLTPYFLWATNAHIERLVRKGKVTAETVDPSTESEIRYSYSALMMSNAGYPQAKYKITVGCAA